MKLSRDENNGRYCVLMRNDECKNHKNLLSVNAHKNVDGGEILNVGCRGNCRSRARQSTYLFVQLFELIKTVGFREISEVPPRRLPRINFFLSCNLINSCTTAMMGEKEELFCAAMDAMQVRFTLQIVFSSFNQFDLRSCVWSCRST